MNNYPIFRLTMFMSAGIFFAEVFRIEAGFYPIVALLSLLLVLGLLLRNHSFGKRWLFGAGVSVFMFLAGVILTEHAWKRVSVDWNADRCLYRGVVMETPQEKARTYQCRLEVSGKEVLVYLPKDSLSASVGIGDELIFETRLESPKNREGIQTFDYACYLYHDGISGTAFVPADDWKKTGKAIDMTLRQKALLFREQVLEEYKRWGVGMKQLPVLSALTLGYKGELDKETLDSYSIAGISHVLALSGMHIGIIWLLLDGVLKPLVRRRLGWLKWLLTTFTLWAFAFVVGLEASVVRAVVMCMLMELGRLLGRRPLSMNTLAIAAFLMLFYRPFYLFDVGFQLSFVAVASILILYPLISGCLSVKNRVGRYVWSVLSVSMSAQLGTAPLVMYYFSNFSVYFLFANCVVAVLVPLIIYGAILMLLMSSWSWGQKYVVEALNGGVTVMNEIAAWTSRLPYATFSFSVIKPLEIVVFYIILALGVAYWKTGRRKWLVWILVGIVSLLSLHLCVLLTGR